MGKIRMEPKNPRLRFVAMAPQRERNDRIVGIRCGRFLVEVKPESDLELLDAILNVLEARAC